ncbi:MAG TPA: Uma2 family endonuclease [Cyclobacteriaceae bacterium]
MTQAAATTHKINHSISAMRLWEKLPEGTLAEVIYGKLYILCMPERYHQKIAGDLFGELWLFAKTTGVGSAYIMNTGVFLNEGSDVVGPDVVFITNNNNLCAIDDKGLFGPPDLIIEVLSSNKKHDRVLKLELYEKAGVREYWIVDPETKDSFGFLLKNNRYDEPLLMNAMINIRILNKTINF